MLSTPTHHSYVVPRDNFGNSLDSFLLFGINFDYEPEFLTKDWDYETGKKLMWSKIYCLKIENEKSDLMTFQDQNFLFEEMEISIEKKLKKIAKISEYYGAEEKSRILACLKSYNYRFAEMTIYD